MANGIQIIPTINPHAGLALGLQNLFGGLNQQFQQRQQVSDTQALLQFLQQTQQGGTPGLPQFNDPRAGMALANFMAQRGQGGFTLGPGQQRFDPGGQQIAAGPAAILSPSQQIAQQKLNRIKQLQAIPVDQRTPAQSESLKRLIEGQAAVQINLAKPAAASERTAIAETNASLDALNNLETLFNKSTTVTGPIAGRFETAKGFFGLSSEDQENLLAATSAFKNKVIKDITGAQMSEQEAKRIMKQIPLETDPPARWRAKKKQTEINLRAIQERRIQVLQQSGIVAPGGAIPGDQSVGQQLPARAVSAAARTAPPEPFGVPFRPGSKINIQSRAGHPRIIPFSALKHHLNQGDTISGHPNIAAFQNTSGEPQRVGRDIAAPGEWAITFDGGRTWQKLQ